MTSATATLGLSPAHQEMRRRCLTASKIAAAVGLSPWESVLGAYLSYVEPGYQRKMTESMEWGLRHEPALSQKYSEVTGLELEPAPFFVHPEHSWAGASPDRIATDGSRLVELKTGRLDNEWGEGPDDIPEQYMLQTQWQMFVAGFPTCDVAVLIGGQKFLLYTVERNESIIASLFDIGQSFWQRVVNHDPPPIDWQDPRTPDLVGILRKPNPHATVELDGEALAMVEDYEGLGRQIKDLAERRDLVKAQLIDCMGHAGVGMLPDGEREIRRKIIHKDEYTVRAHDENFFRICKQSKQSKKGR